MASLTWKSWIKGARGLVNQGLIHVGQATDLLLCLLCCRSYCLLQVLRPGFSLVQLLQRRCASLVAFCSRFWKRQHP
jgi:hypothetical protein